MVKPKTLAADYCVNDQTFVTKATVKLSDGIKAQVALRHPSQAVAVTLTGDKWELQHDFKSKDTRMKYKTKVAGGSTLTIKQHVPQGKAFLVPNPEFELSRGGLLGKHSKTVAAYDCLNRVGRLEGTVYAGDDKQHKAYVKLASTGGASGGLRSKIKAGPLLHSVAASFSQKGGPQLVAKSKLSDGTKIKSSYALCSDTLTVAAKHTPQGEGDGAKPTVSLTMVIPVKKQQDPRVMLGVKWDL